LVVHALADNTLHGARPVRSWFWISSPTVRIRRLPKWSMSSASTIVLPAGVVSSSVAGVQRTMYLIVATMSSIVSVCCQMLLDAGFLLIL